MRFSSLLGMPINYDNGGSNAGRSSNNQDTVYPQFGHYSAASSSDCGSRPPLRLMRTPISPRPPATTGRRSSRISTRTPTARRRLPVSPAVSPPLPRATFPRRPISTRAGLCPNGVPDAEHDTITNHVQPEFRGYGLYLRQLPPHAPRGPSTATRGAGLLGQDVLIWPPDPTNDWRTEYFNFPTAQADNSLLWDTSNGNWQAPVSAATAATPSTTARS